MKNKYAWGSLLTIAVVLLIAWSPFHQANKAAAAVVVAPSETLQKPSLSGLNAAKQMSQAFIEVSKKVTPSIVMIVNEEEVKDASADSIDEDLFQNDSDSAPNNRDQIQKSLGSGVIVSADGYIVTNNHVVDHSNRLHVTLPDGSKLPARIIGKDSKTDLALIKVNRNELNPIAFGSYQDIQVGEWVLAVGTPFDESLHHTVTAGIVSAKGRSNVGIADYEDFLQTDAAINPGNSGGALVDLDGNLIGINTAIMSNDGSNSGVGFAIPVNIIQNVMQQLRSHGRVIRGYLGVSIQDLTGEMKTALNISGVDGAVISDIVKDSPADKAGLRSYDVIRQVDGKPVQNSFELRQAISALSPGAKTRLAIIRDGKEQTVGVDVSEADSDQADNHGGQIDPSGKLGVELQNLTPSLARKLETDVDNGVVITNVASGSLAEEADLEEGDVIFEANRRKITSAREFQEFLKNEKDSSILLAVDRQGNSFFVTIQLD